MKNGKCPTRKQMKAIEYVRLSPANWLVFKIESNQLHIVHRLSGKTRIIPA